jgi:hypothetical protein
METNMTTDYKANKDIDHSLQVGAKALAVGAVLVLVLAVTGMPDPKMGDPLMGMPTATSPVGEAQAAAPGAGDATATMRIEVPFKSTQRDVEELPPQF